MVRGLGFSLLVTAILLAAWPLEKTLHAQEGKAAVAAADNGGNAAPVHKSRFVWFIQSSGVIGLFIFGLSVYFVATCVRLFMELRPAVAQPPEEMTYYEQLLSA